MKRTFRFAALLIAISPAIFVYQLPIIRAQQSHRHQAGDSKELGQVNFPISCNAKTQKQFNLAVAWLHSFEYEEAERVFTKVTVSDPQCAMGFWGIAMSNYHPLWAPPNAAALRNGTAAAVKAKSIGAPTERERAFIEAINLFYKDSDKLDHRTRSLAYTDAMERFYQRNNSDDEAGIFYSLALIAKGAMTGDKTYGNEYKAARILNAILPRQPRHPGVTHYLIHGYDYPSLAHLALPAARSYAKIAPASAHARHMPSHIFTRLGLWQEAIQSNLGAKTSAEVYALNNKMPGSWDERLHAMDYLAYAYLQSGQDKLALGVIDELYKIKTVEPANFKVAYSFTAIPSRYALERRQWSEAAKLPLHPGNMEAFPWENYRWAEAHIHFARAVGAARSGDTTTAQQEVEKLVEIRQSLANVKGGYDWANQVEIARMAAAAWLAHAEGKPEEALRLMRAAATLDDETEKHPVTPGAILPVREQLGELLLEIKQPAAALREFEISLRTSPNRFNGLYGAARAANLAADRKQAQSYYEKLVEMCRLSDSGRPEIEEAKQFLAETKSKSAAKTKSKQAVNVNYTI